MDCGNSHRVHTVWGSRPGGPRSPGRWSPEISPADASLELDGFPGALAKRVRFRDPAGAVRDGTWTDDAVSFSDAEYAHEKIDVLPPTDPSKIVCVGLDYADDIEKNDDTLPERVRLFLEMPNIPGSHGETIISDRCDRRRDVESDQ